MHNAIDISAHGGVNQDKGLEPTAAICNRVSRMLGLLDREGLQRDLAIVQTNVSLDLDALLASPDQVFIEELLHIVECADRTTGSVSGAFHSRFIREDERDKLFRP